jgi:ketosteroid isomerase-like protein
MSEENVEIVRQAFETFQAGMERGDPGAAYDSGVMVVDAEWVTTREFEGRTVWAGREEFVEFVRTWTEQLDDWSVRVERLIDAGGDRVVALTHQSAIGKESGVPVEWDNGLVYELKDGLIVRVTNYVTHADAIEAAGLPE